MLPNMDYTLPVNSIWDEGIHIRFEFKVKKRTVKRKATTPKHSLTTGVTGSQDVCKKRKLVESASTCESSGNLERDTTLNDNHEGEIGRDKDNIKEEENNVVDNDGDFTGRRSKDEENYDEDNEEHVECQRKQFYEIGYVNIKHHLATNLENVGEQVWLGALLLCDYIIDQCEEFTGLTVLDLGSGTGLTSIVTGLYADHVYCTDTGESVLVLAQENIETARLYPSLPWPIAHIDVCDLNWFTGLKEPVKSLSKIFDLRKETIDAIQTAEVIIAADVVYDDAITDAFFQNVWSLLDQPIQKRVYIGLEKRLVFTLEDLDIASPAYRHFRQGLDDLKVKGQIYDVNIHIQQIHTDFEQHFKYTRTKQLELWKIWTERGVT